MEEDEVYLQLVLPEDKDSELNNYIYLQIITHLTHLKNLICKKIFNPFEKTITLSYLSDNSRVIVNSENFKKIKSIVDKVKKGDVYLSSSSGKNKFITETFSDTKFQFYFIFDEILICRTTNLTPSESGYLQYFMEKINFDIVYREDTFDVRRALGLEALKIPTIDFKSRNLVLNGEESSHFFKISNKLELESCERIKNSELPVFFYQTDNVKSKYLFLLKFKELHKKQNLPSTSLQYLYKNLNSQENKVECLSKKNYKDITSEDAVVKFRTREFEFLEESVTFLVQLVMKNISGSIIPHNGYYYCCYSSDTEQNFQLNPQKSKSYLLQKIPGDVEKLLEVPLSKLVTGYLDEGKFILPDEKKFADNEIPIDNYILENSHIFPYNLTGELETFPEKKKFGFDRSEIILEIGIIIRLEEKVDCINSLELIIEGMKIELEEDFWINDEEDRDFFKICVRKLWRSGHLLTSYGLWRYICTGEILDRDITFPNWFRSDGEKDWVWLKKQLELVS